MELIVENKTVSIKHYLNKSVKPIILEDGSNGYPLYSMVIYDTKNNKFKTSLSLNSKGAKSIILSENQESGFSDGIFGKYTKIINRVDEKILNIVKYEIETYKDKASLRGLGKRLSLFGNELYEVAKYSAFTQYTRYLGSKMIYNDYIKVLNKSQMDAGILYSEVNKIDPKINESAPSKMIMNSLMTLALRAFGEEYPNSNSCYDWLIGNARFKFQTDFFTKITPIIQQELQEFDINELEGWKTDLSLTYEIDLVIKESVIMG